MEATPQPRFAVLIVDDEPEMCWVFKTLLEQHGYTVQLATSGQEAISLAAEGNFQVMLLDAKLPDMEGRELARKMAQLSPGARLIMVSGYFYNDDIQIETAITSGVISAFISKPFENDKILNLLKTS